MTWEESYEEEDCFYALNLETYKLETIPFGARVGIKES